MTITLLLIHLVKFFISLQLNIIQNTNKMFGQISVFLVVLLFNGLKCQEPQLAASPTQSTTPDENVSEDNGDSICGQWYAVMATGTNDGGPCSILTNNINPCQCISAYIVTLQTDSYLVYTNAVNIQSSTLTVDMGGMSNTEDNPSIVKGFSYSRVIMPLSAIATEDYVSEKSCGMGNFMQFEMSILVLSEDNDYMISKITFSSGSTPLIIVWSRNKTPGKETLWKKILDGLYSVQLNPHDLQFINQIGCKYPTPNQYNEMFFCTTQVAV